MEIKDADLSQAMAKIEIISFFRNNPHTRDTVEGLSRRLFLDTRLVAPVLEELVTAGIMNRAGRGQWAVYRLRTSYATVDEYRIAAGKGDS